MSEGNTVTYDMLANEPRIAGMARQTGHASPRQSAGRAYYLFDTASRAENQPFSETKGERQVREDKEFYIPNFLSDEHYESHPELHAAAAEHAGDLRRAERCLDEALNLIGVLLASMEDPSDSRAMQAETVPKIIEKKLTKAHTQIDKHGTRHTNLFLAYFDLKDKSGGRATGAC
jgi:hypothetical protein